jgi:hypothetical protein
MHARQTNLQQSPLSTQTYVPTSAHTDTYAHSYTFSMRARHMHTPTETTWMHTLSRHIHATPGEYAPHPIWQIIDK